MRRDDGWDDGQGFFHGLPFGCALALAFWAGVACTVLVVIW